MSRDYIKIRSNPEREQRLEQAKDALARIGEDVDQDSTTIDIALAALPQLIDQLEEETDEMKARADEVSGDALTVGTYAQIKLRDDL